MSLARFELRSLAWAMMEVVASHLVPDDRCWLCVRIGAGEIETALVTLVGTCMRNDVVLPRRTRDALREWLRGYSGTEVAVAFAPYLGDVQADIRANSGDDARESLRTNCDRFGKRPRRVPSTLAASGRMRDAERTS